MKLPTYSKYQAISISFCLLALIIFNATRRSPEPEESREFYNAIRRYEEKSKDAFEEGRGAGPASISIHERGNASPRAYVLDNRLRPTDRGLTEDIVHLIDLAYAAQVIGQNAQSGDFSVEIDIDNRSYMGSFNRSDVQKRPALTTLLKLLSIRKTDATVSTPLQ